MGTVFDVFDSELPNDLHGIFRKAKIIRWQIIPKHGNPDEYFLYLEREEFEDEF